MVLVLNVKDIAKRPYPYTDRSRESCVLNLIHPFEIDVVRKVVFNIHVVSACNHAVGNSKNVKNSTADVSK